MRWLITIEASSGRAFLFAGLSHIVLWAHLYIRFDTATDDIDSPGRADESVDQGNVYDHELHRHQRPCRIRSKPGSPGPHQLQQYGPQCKRECHITRHVCNADCWGWISGTKNKAPRDSLRGIARPRWGKLPVGNRRTARTEILVHGSHVVVRLGSERVVGTQPGVMDERYTYRILPAC